MKLREETEEFYLHLEKIIRVKKMTIPSKKKNYDLVLEIMSTEDQSTQWCYYFACHKARCLFWLEEYDASSLIDGVESPAHISASPSFINLSLNSLPLSYVQSIAWRICIGTLPVFFWSRNPFFNLDIVLIGTTGHSFQQFSRVVDFRFVSMTNSWACWHSVA